MASYWSVLNTIGIPDFYSPFPKDIPHNPYTVKNVLVHFYQCAHVSVGSAAGFADPSFMDCFDMAGRDGRYALFGATTTSVGGSSNQSSQVDSDGKEEDGSTVCVLPTEKTLEMVEKEFLERQKRVVDPYDLPWKPKQAYLDVLEKQGRLKERERMGGDKEI